MQIGVFGSHDIKKSSLSEIYAIRLGELIANGGHILITGASRGVSDFASIGARRQNGLVVAVSPEINKVANIKSINHENQDVLILTGLPFKMRNVITVMSCDVCVFISGGHGTLNEYTIAIDYGKPCIIIRGTGGASDIIDNIDVMMNKQKNIILFVDTPEEAYIAALSL